jgi:hypothetical protein
MVGINFKFFLPLLTKTNQVDSMKCRAETNENKIDMQHQNFVTFVYCGPIRRLVYLISHRIVLKRQCLNVLSVHQIAFFHI